MVPDPTKACIGMEYFCFAGDELWEMADALQFGFATRVPKAYPMYDLEYSDRVDTIKSWLAPIENLQQVGRNGLHRYNNSDHSMLTAMRAVDNLLLNTNHDIWAVNAESVYHEEATAQDSEQPCIKAPETPAQREPLAPAPAPDQPSQAHPNRPAADTDGDMDPRAVGHQQP